jgi:hypothetical protein
VPLDYLKPSRVSDFDRSQLAPLAEEHAAAASVRTSFKRHVQRPPLPGDQKAANGGQLSPSPIAWSWLTATCAKSHGEHPAIV